MTDPHENLSTSCRSHPLRKPDCWNPPSSSTAQSCQVKHRYRSADVPEFRLRHARRLTKHARTFFQSPGQWNGLVMFCQPPEDPQDKESGPLSYRLNSGPPDTQGCAL